MRLTEQLKELAEGSAKRHPGQAQEIMATAIKQLEATNILEKAYKTGDFIPNIQLSNANGDIIAINDILENNKIVLSFYRGAWCPYCNLELKALQNILPQIEEKGAKLIAISPQTPDNTLTTKEKNALKFEVLSDVNGATARQMNLIYQLPQDLANLYKTFSIDLETSNGNNSQELPIAATYIIEQTGKISYHFLAEDYKLRADPKDFLDRL